MTRDRNEVDIGNIGRAKVANDCGADAFIRIHANGSEDKSMTGAMTICQTRNNPYTNQYTESRRLAECVLDEFCAATGARRMSLWETDSMGGINWSRVPTIILEMGFMSNAGEDLLMATDDYQSKMVEGASNGIDEFLSTVR
jgi:N-acetylmuramoyl-L-alanine amidase